MRRTGARPVHHSPAGPEKERLMTPQILILDEDHVIRMLRFALVGPAEVSEDFARAFFAPEPVDLDAVRALAKGLHPSDGVVLIPAAAKPDVLRGTDASILIFRRGSITADLMDANPKLRLIQRLGARSDSIDVKAAAARGIKVSCLPRPTLNYTAEHAILFMLALGKRLVEGDAAVRADRWDRALVHPSDSVAYNWAGLSNLSGLFGKTLGIIGLGEVGAIIAHIARGFGMQIFYTNRRRLPAAQEAELGVTYVPTEQLLAQADFVVLSASNIPENRGLMDGAAFAAMKPSAFFVNISRGKLVDEAALHAALTGGQIAGAGLDVHWEEPRSQPDPLAKLSNIIMTPHYAGGSRLRVLDEIKAILDNCRAALAGSAPSHNITPERGRP